MNDDCTATASFVEQLLEPGQEFFHAANGIEAMVTVPDIADDHGGLRGLPCLGQFPASDGGRLTGSTGLELCGAQEEREAGLGFVSVERGRQEEEDERGEEERC